MRIAILVEGKTEVAFLPALRAFLQPRLEGRMPRLDVSPYDGRIRKGNELSRVVRRLLTSRERADAVIALTDVYTGTQDFTDAADAKRKMLEWVGNVENFFPHVAQHDFEAWLIPFWNEIQRLAGSNRRAPGNPENINHQRPPAYLLNEIFLAGSKRKSYVKPRDAARILREQDLRVAALACPTLKDFLNRILSLAGGVPL